MEDFYCAICKNIPKFPLILTCCLKTICKEHKTGKCQFCQIDLTNEAVQTNSILLHYFNSQISVKCDRCEAAPSTVSCHNCRASLCRDCSSCVHSEGIYARHVLSNCSQLMNNADNVDICPTHKLPLKFFCTKDWIGLCRRCKESHNSHGPVSIEEAFSSKLTELNIKLEELENSLNEARGQKAKWQDRVEDLIARNEACKAEITSKFKEIKKAVEWKEEEILREIEVIFRRKKIEIEYYLDPVQKSEEKLSDITRLLVMVKDLNPNTVLSQINFINKILSSADEINIQKSNLTPKVNFPVKFDVQYLVGIIEAIALSDDTLSINNSAMNTSLPNSASSLKSPQLRKKPSFEKSITPTKSRSNSRESQNLDENPLEARVFKKKLQSATAIQVSWSHPARPVQGLNYCLEYGVGMKLNNIEQFRQVYKGTAHTCIITDLLPKTSYRFRVAATIADNKGDWSDIVTVTTFDTQKIDPSTFAAHANMANRAQEKYIQFDKPGIILGTNPYMFGKYSWEVKVFNNTLYSTDGNLVRVGVCGFKSKIVHGIDVEYQAARGVVKVKVMLDVEGKVLHVVNCANGQSESVYSLPDGPFMPAVQYKPNKGSTAPIRVSVDFEV